MLILEPYQCVLILCIILVFLWCKLAFNIVITLTLKIYKNIRGVNDQNLRSAGWFLCQAGDAYNIFLLFSRSQRNTGVGEKKVCAILIEKALKWIGLDYGMFYINIKLLVGDWTLAFDVNKVITRIHWM